MGPMFSNLFWKSNLLEWHIPICLNYMQVPNSKDNKKDQMSYVIGLPQMIRLSELIKNFVQTGADWVLKPAVAKILERPFLPFLSSFFLVSNRPWAAQNQAAHVAIAKTPQRPVRPCVQVIWIITHIHNWLHSKRDQLQWLPYMIFSFPCLKLQTFKYTFYIFP